MKSIAFVLWAAVFNAGGASWLVVTGQTGAEWFYSLSGFMCGLAYAWWREIAEVQSELRETLERVTQAALVDKDTFGGWREVE